MRRINIAVLLLMIVAVPVIACLPVDFRQLPSPSFKMQRIERLIIKPAQAGTFAQIAVGVTPDGQTVHGDEYYELYDRVIEAGTVSWFASDPYEGEYCLYHLRGFLRYDTSRIPNNAKITSVRLVIRNCEEILSDSGQPFELSLNRCFYDRKIDIDNIGINFNRAVNTATASIDLGISSSIPSDNYEIAIPDYWINKRGFTDMSIVSIEELNGIPVLGDQRTSILRYWSEYPGRVTNDSAPTLQIEYLSR